MRIRTEEETRTMGGCSTPRRRYTVTNVHIAIRT